MDSVFLAYLAVAVLGFVIVFAMLLLGMEDLDISGDDGFGPLSPILLAAFFGAFGSMGSLLTQFTDMAQLPVLGVSVVSSAPVYVGGYFGMKKYIGHHDDHPNSMQQPSTLIGRSATVIDPIKGEDGVGRVTYFANGATTSAAAISTSGDIRAGTSVKIIGLAGPTVIVEKEE